MFLTLGFNLAAFNKYLKYKQCSPTESQLRDRIQCIQVDSLSVERSTTKKRDRL